MAKILITDGMAQEGLDLLVAAGHQVENRKVPGEELSAIIGQYDGLVVRSATQVTAEVLKAGAPKLKIVGRAGVGVDNVDVATATDLGVIVMNAPLGNIISAAEHTLGMIFAVARMIPQAHAKLAQGTWDKKSFTGVELHGKTLGVIGLGKIGKHVSDVLRTAGMSILAYDPFLSPDVAAELRIESVGLEEVFRRADFLTVHTPLTDKTRNLIGGTNLKLMKKTARLVNVARGGIVDEAALAVALKTGALAGAALDVFVNEPLEKDSPLFGVPNCILTPHLGASTEEAQVKVSVDIAKQFNAWFSESKIINAVNVNLRVDPAIDAYVNAAEQLASALIQTLDAPLTGLEVMARGELAQYDTKPLAVAALKGALAEISDQVVNVVNAPNIAKDRGITLTSSSSAQQKDWADQLSITAVTTKGKHSIGGAVVNGQIRVLRYDDFPIDLPIGGNLLIMEYPDRPGMVGKYGSILGENRINIARMEVSRIDGRGDALVILTLDDPVPPQVLDQITEAVNPNRAYSISI